MSSDSRGNAACKLMMRPAASGLRSPFTAAGRHNVQQYGDRSGGQHLISLVLLEEMRHDLI